MPGFENVSNFATGVQVMCFSAFIIFCYEKLLEIVCYFPLSIKKVDHPTASSCLVMTVSLSLQKQNVLKTWSLLLL